MKGIEEIAKKLEEGVQGVFEGDQYRRYLEFSAKFYQYSMNNTLLIFMQKPDASYVAGYTAWQDKFKRQVRKGEKGIRILAPIPHKKIKEVVAKDGTTEEAEVVWTSFREVCVFDISQTDGDEIPAIVKRLEGSVDEYEELVDKLMKISPVPIQFEDIGNGANGYYSHSRKLIAVQKWLSEQQTIKTMIHEIGHALLHAKGTGEEENADQQTREVQAESVSYIVCNRLGIDTSDYSFGYVVGWSSGKDCKELLNSMDVIKRTAKEILDDINE